MLELRTTGMVLSARAAVGRSPSVRTPSIICGTAMSAFQRDALAGKDHVDTVRRPLPVQGSPHRME